MVCKDFSLQALLKALVCATACVAFKCACEYRYGGIDSS
jgi:hypothetical protein